MDEAIRLVAALIAVLLFVALSLCGCCFLAVVGRILIRLYEHLAKKIDAAFNDHSDIGY